eukprot:7237715-Prymnesium_polylepis.1
MVSAQIAAVAAHRLVCAFPAPRPTFRGVLPCARDRTPDTNAAPIAPDSLLFGAARANSLAWLGPSP